MIGIDVTNHTDKIVRSATIRACAYDESGLPVNINLQFHRGQDSQLLNLSDENLPAGGFSAHVLLTGAGRLTVTALTRWSSSGVALIRLNLPMAPHGATPT